jgi:hypothetical protein
MFAGPQPAGHNRRRERGNRADREAVEPDLTLKPLIEANGALAGAVFLG